MIGTNNSGSEDGKSIAEGVTLIVRTLRAKSPDSKVLLLAIFPRNTRNDKPSQMEAINQANQIIAKLDDGKMVRFLNINDKFVGPDGKVPSDIMPDFLHPNAHGYEIWAEAMEPTLTAMLK